MWCSNIVRIACWLAMGAMILGGGADATPRQTNDSAARANGKANTGTVRAVTGDSAQINTMVAGTPPSATISIVPVPAKVGSYPPGTTIVGNELRASASGFRAWFEFRLLGWDPNHDHIPPLGGFQVTIDATGYMDSDAPGDQPDLAPPVIPCASSAVCVAAFGESSAGCELGTCAAAYGRTCDTSTLDFRCVAYNLGGVGDDGTPLYGGTVVLDIPPGAEGKYTVNLKTDETFMWDSVCLPDDIPTLSETGFVVNIVSCTGPADCSDGLFCNGQEMCNLGTGFCGTGTPPCTAPTPTCDEATDSCVGCATPGHPPCDDGLFCNGVEFCDLASGLCAQSGNPCLANQICDEDTDACLNFGACCLDMGAVCFETNEPDCVDLPPDGAGGTFLGAGSTCPQQFIDVPILEGDGSVFVHHIELPRDCPAPGPARAVAACPPSGPYTDPWVSEESGSLCHNFGSSDTDPIPAGFFDPGSDPFTSAVCLRGVPLGIPQYGDADTLISRSADPFDRCDLPSGTPSTVNIEIVALSLESVDPITVTYNGGQNPETWNVTVDLSLGGLPPGTPPRTLTATKTHCNGGTYTSVLYVQPRFTFTKVSNPSEVRVLDTGMTGTPPVELVQSVPKSWVSDIDPFLGAMVDLCSDFHANISDNNPLLECDCNANSRRDRCDIEDGVSLDCNANGVPDSCDLSNGTSQDVNGNGVPDECDPPVIVWNSDPLSPDRTTRSLRFTLEPAAGAAGTGGQSAIRVELVSLHHPDPRNAPAFPPPNASRYSTFDTNTNGVCSGATTGPNYNGHPCDDANPDCLGDNANPLVTTDDGVCSSLVACTAAGETNGCARWVGRPGTFYEAQDDQTIGQPYRLARLQCTPFYADWVAETHPPINPLSLIAAVGAEILPSSEYSVQAYGSSCRGSEGSCTNVSAPVQMLTRRHGDLYIKFRPPDTSVQPDAVDVSRVVDSFKKLSTGLVKAISRITPNLPEENDDVNANDISSVVDATKGYAYKFGGPCPCPSAATCGALACPTGADGVCVGSALLGLGAEAKCIKTCTGGPNHGEPCLNGKHCRNTCATGPKAGQLCDSDPDCGPGHICTIVGTCGTPLCRDRCGRCEP